MSLIINADGEYIAGGGTVFGASGLTECTFGIWVKRDSASSAYQSYAYIGRDVADAYGSMCLAHNGNGPDCWAEPSGATHRINSGSGSDSTSWQLLVLTYKKDVEAKTYAGITGGSLVTNTLSSPTYAFNADIDNVRIGIGRATADEWYPRAKLAHNFFYDVALTPAQVAELFNGGTAGAGKNPQAVQAANLKFYAPLTSDATVTIGGVTLSATGTITYDGAENPNVEAYGGGSVDGAASGATLTGTSSLTAGGASGTASGTATGANLTGTSSISAGAATGNATGSFTTAAMENNSGAGLLASTAVSWTWYQGTIGAAPTSTTHGTGTTNGSGILTVAGLPIAAGFLLARTADSSGVYYQAGTPA